MQLSGFYPSVCLSVCLSVPLSHSSAAAVGLLLWVRRAGNADRSQQHGAQWHGERRVNAGSATLSADVAS